MGCNNNKVRYLCTSRKHDESILQQLVRFVSMFVTFTWVHIFLLAVMEMTKCNGERKVWQLGQIPMFLEQEIIVLELEC